MKACAYIRVSTRNDGQDSSYKTQYEYWHDKLSSDDCELTDIYFDRMSGYSMAKRGGLQQLIKDAKQKKFDVVYTKSISRLSRNMVELLALINEFRDLGIYFVFEKENLNTKSAKTQFLISIIGRIGEEERLSVSKNLKWTFKKMFESGEPRWSFKGCYGYKASRDSNDNCVMEINKDQAEVVRIIYEMYASGQGSHKIYIWLKDNMIKSPRGLDIWDSSYINSILRDVKYKGDLVLQTKVMIKGRSVKNKLEKPIAPMYYIANNHEPIIQPELFEKVQRMLDSAKHHNQIGKDVTHGYFHRRVKCGVCGKYCSERKKENEKYYYCCYSTKKITDCNVAQVPERKLIKYFKDAYEIARVYDGQSQHQKDMKSKLNNCLEYERSLERQYVNRVLNEDYYRKEKGSLTKEIEELEKIINKCPQQQKFIEYKQDNIGILIDNYLDSVINLPNNKIEIVFKNGYVFRATYGYKSRTNQQKDIDCALLEDKVWCDEINKGYKSNKNNGYCFTARNQVQGVTRNFRIAYERVFSLYKEAEEWYIREFGTESIDKMELKMITVNNEKMVGEVAFYKATYMFDYIGGENSKQRGVWQRRK